MRRDHDPATLDAWAGALERAISAIDPTTKEGRWAVRDVRESAALLRRLANDLRLVNRFLREASLLAPGVLDDDDPTRSDDSPARAHGAPAA